MGGSRTARSKRIVGDPEDNDGENGDGERPRRAGGPRAVQETASSSQQQEAWRDGPLHSSIDGEHAERSRSFVESSTPTNSPLKSQKTALAANQKGKSNEGSPTHGNALRNKKSHTATKSASSKPSKTIYSFFNAATKRQQTPGEASPDKSDRVQNTVEEEDSIVDEVLDEDPQEQRRPSSGTVPLRKRKLEEEEGGIRRSNSNHQGGQKFLKLLNGRKSSSSQDADTEDSLVDGRPWFDRYAPQTVEELSVHKKKVSDVREWLELAIQGRGRKQLLVIKGGAGTGKTATVRLLAQQLDANIREWHNPSGREAFSEGFVSIASQFQDFIGSSGKVGSLELVNPARTNLTLQEKRPLESTGNQISLIEELPNVFMRSSSALTAFRSAILQYLAISSPAGSIFSQPPGMSVTAPVVLIYSESLLSNSTASVDSLTVHRLLGPEIMNHPGVSIIEFNPVAPTILTKALELVIRKEARDSGRRRAPGPAVLKHLSEIGDIRSAVSALEFICLRGDEPNTWSGRVAATAVSKGRKGTTNDAATLTEVERNSLELITQRENTLGIFHSVGKIVYNKRQVPSATDTPPPQPPIHLSHQVRSKVPETDVEILLDELGTDIQTFIAALHENYVLSCSNTEPDKTLDSINECIDTLSSADLLCSDNLGASGLFRRVFRGNSGDSLRQEEISYQVAARGLMFSLPYPVKRIPPPSSVQTSVSRAPNASQSFGGKGDAFRMFYPASLKLWRQREEIEGLLTVLMSKRQRGELRNFADPAGQHSTTKSGGIESWKTNGSSRFARSSDTPPQAIKDQDPKQVEGDTQISLLVGSTSAKRELLLELLPYLARINQRHASESMRPDVLRQIDTVTLMAGLPSAADEDSDGEDLAVEASAALPSATLVHRAKQKQEGLTASIAAKEGQGLFLSDDDIEDD